jgi:death on curing protein
VTAYLTLAQARILHDGIATGLKVDFDAPMRAFDERFPGRLEAIVMNPAAQFEGHELYPTFPSKCAVLFRDLACGHAFVDGNKRMAIAGTWGFAFYNDFVWLMTDEHAYELATVIADTRTEDRDSIVGVLTTYFEKRLETREEFLKSAAEMAESRAKGEGSP